MSVGLKEMNTKFEIAEDVFQLIEQIAKLLKNEKINLIDAAFCTEVSTQEQVKKIKLQSELGTVLTLNISTQFEELSL